MNNGLLAWPEGRVLPPPGILSWPRRLLAYEYPRPRIDVAGITATTGSGTNMVVNLPTYAEGDTVFIALKCDQNNTPGTPSGWRVLQSGAQGSQGNITLVRLMDGTEGATVTVTSGISANFAALAFRVTNAGKWTSSIAQSTTGSTPNINGANMYPGFNAGGALPSVGFILLTALGTITLNGGGGTGSVAASGFVNTVEGNITTYTNISEAVNGSLRAIVMWADMPTTTVAGFAGVGTWTNFTCVQVSVPSARRPVRVIR